MSGNILSATSALGTLGLPVTVESALANVSVENSGAFGAPEYHQPQGSPPWWESYGKELWNAVSGVAQLTGLSELISVGWNEVQAAEAYIGSAGAWLSSHLGIGKLTSQFVKTLEAIASAMLWAIAYLYNHLWSLVVSYFTAPLIGFRLAADAEASAISSAGNATSSYGATSPQSLSRWGLAIAPLLVISAVVGAVVTVVLDALAPFSDIIGGIAAFIGLVIFAVIGAHDGGDPIHTSLGDIITLTAIFAAANLTALSTVANSGQPTSQQQEDDGAIYGLVAMGTLASGALGSIVSDYLGSPFIGTLALNVAVFAVVIGALLIYSPTVTGHVEFAISSIALSALSIVLDIIGARDGGVAFLGVFGVTVLMDSMALYLTAVSQGWTV